MNEYDDREKWSNEQLIASFAYYSSINTGIQTVVVKEAMRQALLKRMSAASQEDEWEERELHNEIMREGDIYRNIGLVDEPLNSFWFGKNSNEFKIATIIRRVPKKKPPERHGMKFAIAGTPDADLPSVVVLELKDDGFTINLMCNGYYLFDIDKYTGQITRFPEVGEDIGLPLDDQGRLVIE